MAISDEKEGDGKCFLTCRHIVPDIDFQHLHEVIGSLESSIRLLQTRIDHQTVLQQPGRHDLLNWNRSNVGSWQDSMDQADEREL